MTTTIVTGAGSGIGRATALRLAADGHAVTLVGRTEDKLVDTASQIDGDDVLVVPADVSNGDDCRRFARSTIDRFGEITGLVCNAGVGVMGSMDDVTPEDWNRAISIDLTGVYESIRACWAALKTSKGSIVNVSSVSGLGGDWGAFAYNAAKGGVSNMTRGLALDFPRHGIRVNAVAPSLTATEMTEGTFDDDDLVAAFRERIPMGRAAEPDEVGDVIAFLLSHDARFVNGVVLPVDGGLGASNGQPPLG